jgi:hypothetical protein
VLDMALPSEPGAQHREGQRSGHDYAGTAFSFSSIKRHSRWSAS